jgi:VCBS repeat protein/ASPIC/UnbV protein
MRIQWVSAVVGSLIVLGCRGDAGDNDAGVNTYRAESTRKMAQRLADLPGTLDIRLARSMNRERVAFLRDVTLPSGTAERLDFRRLLAGELLRSGDFDAAEAAFDTITMEMEALGPRVAPGYRRSIRELQASVFLQRALHTDCVDEGRPDRCVFPTGGEGPSGAPDQLQRAAEILLAEIRDSPANDREAYLARWLFNLTQRMAGTYPEGVPPDLRIEAQFSATPSLPHFPEIAERLGVDVVGQAGASVMDDFTGDGKLDLLTSSFHFTDQLRFFVNRGDGTLEDRTESAGIQGLVGGLVLRHADYDNDGDLDVYILRGGWESEEGQPNSLLRNNGNGTFDDVTESAGLLEYGPTATAAWSDFDNDGWLDLYVGTEAEMRASPPKANAPRLFRNNRNGTFTDVAAEVGLGDPGFTKGATWGDFDNDGWPDLYLSRFDEPNHLYRNPGVWPGGRFEEVSEKAGVQAPIRSLPAWFWDYDNDGWLDILSLAYDFEPWDEVADAMGMEYDSDTVHLFRNRGDGTFEDVTKRVGLDRVFFTMGSEFGDLDNDGFLDFYAGTGMPPMSILFPNRMFRNLRGERFEDVSAAGFAHLGKGHGGAFGDIDEDGDQDFYAVIGGANQGDRHRNVFFENPGNANNWITVRLQGVQTNRSALGVRIGLVVDGPSGEREIYRWVGGRGSFGGSSLQEEIGIGDATRVRRLEISWPTSGTTMEFTDVPVNRLYRIVEDQETLFVLDSNPVQLGGDVN